ncbi:type II CRISPR RNA-guided endonuclease Cas9 [Sorlinia euscelidii]|uniref:HNH Cas9-type domain-containing protein n=1 Tax=Sorlinia euscelidii TaxID=3081148 RepID=A0ABU7U4B0_9PROT
MSEKNAVDEELSFGIDLGIGSCGWAVLRRPRGKLDDGVIEGWGSWCFDVPETDKERRPTNQIRRANRLLRRVIRRRRNRMAEIRRLFHAEGLLPSSDSDVLRRPKFDPWAARANGLDQLLSPFEFAAALSHIAKRRGFKSAAKNKSANAVGDDQKMLKELETTRGKLARYQTVGKMFFVDPEYKERRRNRDGVYDRTVGRDDLEFEVDALFKAQRRFGQKHATPELQKAFTDIAFFQLPLQDSERLVGMCHFEPSEKRTSKLAPSFEKFRLLTRLVNLRIVRLKKERPLTVEELQRVTADLGKTAKLSVKKVRGLIGLSSDESFANIKAEDEGRDIAVRTGDALPGTATLRKALGAELWDVMQAHPEQLDAIAQILSFYETSEKILAELGKLNLSEPVSDKLQTALDEGLFAKFRGVGHISAKACRHILPHLAQGLRYDAACKMAGYDHAASRLYSDRDAITTKAQFNELVADVGNNIANPIARKALTEGMKQLWAMRNRWGLPGSINIELARDVGNSLEKRRELEKGVKDNTAQRERERNEARASLGLSDVNGDTLLRYRLWKEQGGRCLYSGREIPVILVRSDNKTVQVDHILPWSRFGDDSYKIRPYATPALTRRKRTKRLMSGWEETRRRRRGKRFSRGSRRIKSFEASKSATIC